MPRKMEIAGLVFLFVLLSCGTGMAATHILCVPPGAHYYQGYRYAWENFDCNSNSSEVCDKLENCREIAQNRWRRLYATLARDVYDSMQSGVATYNTYTQTKDKLEKMISAGKLAPNCNSKKQINIFYRDILAGDANKTKNRLDKIMDKKGYDIMCWTHLGKDYYQKIQESVQHSSNDHCRVDIGLTCFDGEEIDSRVVQMHFQSNYLTFSEETLTRIEKNVFKLLQNSTNIDKDANNSDSTQ